MNMSIRFPHLGINFGYVGETVSFFGHECTIYGIIMAAGLLLGLAVIILQAKRSNQNQDLYLQALIPGILFGVVSARVCYVAMHWSFFEEESSRAVWDLRTGGMSFWGGLLGGVIAIMIFCKIRKLSFGRIADTVSIGLVSAQMLSVWGNFFSREFIGEYTDSIFAMQIPSGIVGNGELTEKMQEHLVRIGETSYVQVHPLFFYESIWCLILLLVLLAYNRKKKFQGEIFMRYLAGYSLGNAGIEYLRADKICIPGTGISVLLPVYLGLFVIFSIVSAVRRILSKKREKIHRRRREQRYNSEEKTSKSYEDMQSFQNVRDEFQEIFSEASGQMSERETDVSQKSDELSKTISDSEQVKNEMKY